MPKQPPNLIGCAVGFAAAGCGVGSLVGLGVGPFFFPEPPDGQGTMHEQFMAVYGGMVFAAQAGIKAPGYSLANVGAFGGDGATQGIGVCKFLFFAGGQLGRGRVWVKEVACQR